jgi:catechol 2,3-dioxygenase
MSEEPIYDIAHLGHLELLTPRPDESLRFFVDVMGMTESGRAGSSVYVFFETYLGFRLTEQIVLDDGTEAGMWMTATNKSYDFAYTLDRTGSRGRFHHLTYAVDCREDVLRAADIFLENGVYIETGPHKHAVQQTFFLYVYEPGGNRVEIANAGARLILAPDWKPIVWSEAERRKGQAWGLKTIESFHTYGTPPV